MLTRSVGEPVKCHELCPHENRPYHTSHFNKIPLGEGEFSSVCANAIVYFKNFKIISDDKMRKTRKSSRVNIRGIPPAPHIHHGSLRWGEYRCPL